jgi:hypothetical protein
MLVNDPQTGTYHYGVDLPAPPGAAVVATAPGKVICIQRKGPVGPEFLVQHDGFVAIYGHRGMPPKQLLKAKQPATRARSSVSLEEAGSRSTPTFILRCPGAESRLIRRGVCACRHATERNEQAFRWRAAS